MIPNGAFASTAHALVLAIALAACGRGGYDVVLRDDAALVPDDGPRVWSELGGSASGGGVTNRGDTTVCKRVAIDGNGRTYVLWADAASGARQVYLRYWTGSAWADLGGSGAGGGISQDGAPASGDNYTCPGAITFDAEQQPHVVWHHYTGSSQPAYLRHWTGSAWSELGASASGGGISGALYAWWPTLAIDGAGRPAVTWSSAGRVFVRRYDSGAWSGLAGSELDPGLDDASVAAELPTLAVGASGALFVAWRASVGGTLEVHLSRFAGGVWAGLGGSSGPGGLSQGDVVDGFPVMRLNRSEQPVVVWPAETAGEIFVRRWNGTTWADYGPSLRESGLLQAQIFQTNFVLDGADRPVVTWVAEDTLGQNIYAARWDGQAWRSLSPELGGLSATAQASSWPSIEVGPDGTTYVAWEQATPGGQEVYLKAYVPAPRP